MVWSTEDTLAFITLLITIPTSLIGVWAIIKRWGKYVRRRNSRSRTEVLPVTLNSTHLQHHFPTRPVLSPNLSHSWELGLMSYFHVTFGSLEIRRPIYKPWEQRELA
ncbi:hypothetical protein BDW71DRAFT_187715 [Aspergillus fruticulosus]